MNIKYEWDGYSILLLLVIMPSYMQVFKEILFLVLYVCELFFFLARMSI